jgi:hypothetical protein
VGVRGNVGAGAGVGVDVCVSLAFGMGDGVAVTAVFGVGVGLGVAVIGSTLYRSVSVALLPRDADKQMFQHNRRH